MLFDWVHRYRELRVGFDYRPFSLDGHEYLRELYTDPQQTTILEKAAQMGASEFAISLALWFVDTRMATAIYFFPTDNDVSDFSATRVRPAVERCEHLQEQVGDIDNIHLLKLSQSLLYFRGMFSKARTKSVPADFVIFDELDEAEPKNKAQAIERMSHSPWKWRLELSTPTLPDFGIDVEWRRSDQRYWHVACGCFTGDTRIVVRHKQTHRVIHKSFYELRDVWSEYEALCFDNRRNKQRWRAITAFHHNGRKQVVEARFHGGYKVRCTPSHVFFGLSGKKLKRIEERPIESVVGRGPGKQQVLSVREILAVGGKGGHNVVAAPLDLDTCYVLGAYVAEGSWATANKQIAQISQSERDHKGLIARVQRWAMNNGLAMNRQSGDLRVNLGPRPDLKNWFGQCGGLCDAKRVPAAIMGGTMDQVQAFLDGYLAGDGYARHERTDKRGYRQPRSIHATTVSRQLATDLVFLSRRVGRPFQVHQHIAPDRVLPQYDLTWTENGLSDRDVRHGMSRVSLESLTPAGEEMVYDITVDECHNYVLAESGAVVHNCHEGIVLEDVFPDCVGIAKEGTDEEEVYLRCPKCGKDRLNPCEPAQIGEYRGWVPKQPGNRNIRGYHFTQLFSTAISTAEIWNTFKNTRDIPEFYNSKLGMPYAGDRMPLDPDTLSKCHGDWGLAQSGKHVLIGIDQGEDNHIIVMKPDPNTGCRRIINAVVVEGPDPWPQTISVCRQYEDVRIVIDALPERNEARRLCDMFPGRAFLCFYSEQQKDVISQDTDDDDPDKGRKVTVHRTETLDRVVDGFLWTANGRRDGIVLPQSQIPICAVVKDHLGALAKVKRKPGGMTEISGALEWVYMHIKADHFAHATNYATIAESIDVYPGWAGFV